MRALVTGGAGFIGSHVVEALLARGDEVHVVDDLSTGKREQVPAAATLHVHDIREPLDAIVRESGAQAIVHLAAQADVRVSVSDPVFDAAVNVLGTINVLEAARLVGARGGVRIHGRGDLRRVRAAGPRERRCLPLSPYGAAKLAGEGYLGAFGRLYDAPHVSLRFGNVYGPRQDPHGEAGVVAIFLGRLRDGTPCRIFGDGSQSRDYVYVEDVVRAAVAALDGDSSGVYNVGTGIATSVLELYDICRSTVGTDAAAVHEACQARRARP